MSLSSDFLLCHGPRRVDQYDEFVKIRREFTPRIIKAPVSHKEIPNLAMSVFRDLWCTAFTSYETKENFLVSNFKCQPPNNDSGGRSGLSYKIRLSTVSA